MIFWGETFRMKCCRQIYKMGLLRFWEIIKFKNEFPSSEVAQSFENHISQKITLELYGAGELWSEESQITFKGAKKSRDKNLGKLYIIFF